MGFDYVMFRSYQTAQWIGHPLYAFDTLDSTNTHLWQLLKDGAQPGTAVLALQQQAGRGQWGRTWMSPTGGLYLSIAIAPHIPADESAQLTICSALGVAQILRSHNIPVDLKWPNDLLLQGKKLGGILTETSIRAGKIELAVIGMGLNWCNLVPDHGISLTDYDPQHNLPIQSLEQLAAIALQGIEVGYEHWQRSGIETILPEYLGLLRAVHIDGAIAPLSHALNLDFKKWIPPDWT